MYDIQFFATDDADWAQAIELLDDDTNLPLDLTGLTFAIEVKEHRSGVRIRLSTEDGSISSPVAGQIQWVVPADQVRGLCADETYRVGCTMTSDGGITQLFTGSLAVIDGGFN